MDRRGWAWLLYRDGLKGTGVADLIASGAAIVVGGVAGVAVGVATFLALALLGRWIVAWLEAPTAKTAAHAHGRVIAAGLAREQARRDAQAVNDISNRRDFK